MKYLFMRKALVFSTNLKLFYGLISTFFRKHQTNYVIIEKKIFLYLFIRIENNSWCPVLSKQLLINHQNF